MTRKQRIATLFGSTAVIGAAVLAVLRSAMLVVVVEGHSMVPTFANGDRVLVLRRWPRRWLRRGQIVLVRRALIGPPAARAPEEFFVKRVAGMPGETLTLDAMPSFTADGMPEPVSQQNWYVPEGQIFLCGDNPRSSADSRLWGPVPQQSVAGLVVMLLSRATPADPAAE
ncbi:MAG: hypothetical protein OHK0022_28380 [Roseiflexaceae bacterium]